MRRNSSLRRTKPKSRKWLNVDISCVFLCMKKPFKAQGMKWWSFNKSSTDHAAMQATSHNSGALYPRSRPQHECSHHKKKQALVVAVATVAAAEAAIVAAEAATYMAQLTIPVASRRPRWGTCSLHAQIVAAIKIQSAFRGYSVRKAITVKSKAECAGIRVTTMRSVQAFVRAQQAGVRRQPCKQETWTRMRNSSKERCHESTINYAIKEDSGLASRRREEWDKSTKTLEEIKARQDTKRKAAVKRERAMAYNAFVYQQSTNEVPHSLKGSKLHCNWLERWMVMRLHGSQNCQSIKHAEKPQLPRPQPPPTPKHATKQPAPCESWSSQASRQVSYQNSSPASSNACSNVQSVTSFSCMPNYMANTESTRAKVRAHSTPRQHLGAKCIP